MCFKSVNVKEINNKKQKKVKVPTKKAQIWKTAPKRTKSRAKYTYN